MERASERDRSSRKSSRDHDRDQDRNASKNYQRDRDGDHKQRHRRRLGSSRNSDEKRHRDDDRRHISRDLPASDTEPDFDRRRERSTSRARDSVDREGSEERRYHSSNKRKEHGDEDDGEKSAKRVRVSDLERGGRRERRRFEDLTSEDLNAGHMEEKRDEKTMRSRKKEELSKDRDDEREDKMVKDEILSDGEDKKKSRKEARRFTDSARVEGRQADDDDELLHRKKVKDEVNSKDRIKEEYLEGAQEEWMISVNSKNGTIEGRAENDHLGNFPLEKSSSTPSVAAQESLTLASKVSTNSSTSNDSLPTKVSSFTTTNENEGVSIRSDEVPGKSSTDGKATSIAVKCGSLSLDALAKAKRSLQMRKEMAKLKKTPELNKVASLSTVNSQLSSDKDSAKFPLAGAVRPGPSGPLDSAFATSVQELPREPVVAMPREPVVAPSEILSAAGATSILPGMADIHNIEAVKRAQELAAKMGFRQDPEFAPLINMFPGQLPVDMSVTQKPAKAPVLRLDAQGREIDEHGNVINMPKLTNLSTLKVNINKRKKEAFQIIKPDLDALAASDPHFDDSMGINKEKLLRPKRMTFQFVEEGKWSKQAEIIKFKSQFGEAQAKELKMKQTQLAKAKAEPESNPNLIAVGVRIKKEKQKDAVPEIEWWDKPILPTGIYADVEEKLNLEKITIYVEHPLPIEPPAEPAPPPPQPLKLTKKEQKKLRTQRRLAKERDRQEMIRQGLLEPPKPKVKMSNLMKVLGSEATQDPTKLEMEIRSAAAEREQAHVDRNIARKLTPAERREKKERKLFDDPNSLETVVSVYKIKDLSHPQTRFKVDVNAQENRLTGCAVISDGISVVVVEGGKKPIKRYGKLMLRRINWAAAVGNEEEEGAEDGDGPSNSCALVWQGSVAKPSFNRFLVHQCRSDAAARKVFADAGVPHYWDLALNFSEELLE